MMMNDSVTVSDANREGFRCKIEPLCMGYMKFSWWCHISLGSCLYLVVAALACDRKPVFIAGIRDRVCKIICLNFWLGVHMWYQGHIDYFIEETDIQLLKVSKCRHLNMSFYVQIKVSAQGV